MAWAILFQNVWHSNKEEAIEMGQAVLKLLAPEQDQDRWLKGASSVLYTYVVVSINLYTVELSITHLGKCSHVLIWLHTS